MSIPERKLEQIKNQYNEFKQTSGYIERKEQLKFTDFARSILKQIIQKDHLSNYDLTALIQIFGHGSSTENVKKYIDSLGFEKSYSKSILNKYLEIEQTGFTGRGKSAIKGLTNDQLHAVHEFLINVAKADSEESIRQIVSDFEKQDIPQVKYGVYSPWLYYLHPTICPIVAGPVKNYLHDLGWNTGNYLDAWDFLKQINEVINEDDYGFLDQFIWDTKDDSEHNKYWLFIIPKDYEDEELWEYCKRNSIAAMQYQYESEPKNLVTKNLRLINKIAEGDKVVVYLNGKMVGGIGEVIQPFYEELSHDNGFDGRFGQRIGLRWITDEFEKSIEPIWKELSLKKKKKNLSLQTIHEISEDDYEKIANFFVQTNHSKHNLNPLMKKKQVILYGPPGTGKTYSSKEIAVSLIQKTNLSRSLLTKKSPINTVPTSLNEELFFEKIGRVSVKDQKIAKSIFDWAKEKGFLIRYTDKAANFDYLYDNQEYKLFKIFVDSPEDTFGVMELCFEYLINTPPFHDDSKRLELLRRFNEVSAFSLEDDDINNRPGLQRNIAIWNLDNETELNKFFSALDWFLEVVKEET